MSETTVTRPARQRKKPARFCKLARQGKDVVLVIRQVRPRAGDQVDAYTLESIPSDYGRGLLLHKAVITLEVDVPRSWLRRSRKGLWYCTRDIPAERIRRLFGFVELARAAG